MNSLEKTKSQCCRVDLPMMLPLAQKQRIATDQQGFTLVELLIVVIILGVLSAIAIPTYGKFRARVKVARCMSDIRTIEKEIYAYSTEKGTYPSGTDLSVLDRGNFRDAWGNPYVYQNILENPGAARYDVESLNTVFDLYSKGQDGMSVKIVDEDHPESLDDICRSNDGQYVGTGGSIVGADDGY